MSDLLSEPYSPREIDGCLLMHILTTEEPLTGEELLSRKNELSADERFVAVRRWGPVLRDSRMR